ncbi:hypothetical protein RND64_02575 [Gordonia sp. w5E2]|uniref:type IV toxin-antitoxin system AbiEi family antitoxin domain-containing protein n=1 Tax=Gordonia TaxID=2053 RepID=UPI0009FB7907|nr:MULTISPECIES: type IV toxin-antitoxin system AbiEi family antitoxin domain-containing protein [Gordonia]
MVIRPPVNPDLTPDALPLGAIDPDAVNLGVFSRPELRARGLTDADLRRKVRRGELLVPRRGWYAQPEADPDAVAAAKRYGALSCASALTKHKLWVPPGYESLHVRAGKSATPRRADYCTLPGAPLPVTTITDTIGLSLVCAAGCMKDDDTIATLDSAMHTLDIDVDDLRLMLPQTSPLIEALLLECDPRSMSGTESLTRVRCRRAGFEVEVQPEISEAEHADLRIGRLLIECDSKLYHLSPANYTNDRHRDRRSLTQGRPTLRLTYDDVLYGWEQTLDDITEIVGAFAQ